MKRFAFILAVCFSLTFVPFAEKGIASNLVSSCIQKPKPPPKPKKPKSPKPPKAPKKPKPPPKPPLP